MLTVYTYLVFRLSPNYNFSTITSDFTFHSTEPFPKCCLGLQLLSSAERKCVSDDSNTRLPNVNSTSYSGGSNSQIRCGRSSSNSNESWSFDTNIARIAEFFHDGSVSAILKNESYNLKQHTYCLDAERDTFNLVLILCDPQNSPATRRSVIIILLFSVSFILIVSTFSIYVAIPELREKVKDKCFICYLASLIFNGMYIAMDTTMNRSGRNICYGYGTYT